MKLFLLLSFTFLIFTGQAQVKDNKTKQVEQLQQLRQTVTRKIDTLRVQLTEQASVMDDVHRKLDQLKKETSNQDKPDQESKKQQAKLNAELNNLTNYTNTLQKKFDSRLVMLDQAVTLQKDLDDKINTLVRGNNQ